MMARRVTRRRIEAALSTLADLTTEEHDELDVIDVLDQLSWRRAS